MPQSTNLNKAPYFDDFDPTNNFYRVLFRPSHAIQSRELTTLQSILQNQIENLSKANFKQGSVVVPGEIIVDSQYNYIKISSFTNNLLITDYIGKKVTGSSSGVVATVVNATPLTDTDSATLFVKYENGGTSNTQKTFIEGETITANSAGNPTAIVGISGNVKPTSSPAIGFGSAVTVREGIYFINGILVRNNTETLILDKYTNIPSYKVGFVVAEQLITSDEDFSLLDNAQGYSNFSAPGAHRLKLIVSLNKRQLDAPDQKDFVQLLLIQSGLVNSTVDDVQSNTIIQNLLARRTFDESGDYVVRDFSLTLKESLNDGSNNGVYTADTGGNADKFIIALNPGKAYVRGYEIETSSVRYIDVDKARDTETQSDAFISPLEGSNYTIKNLYSFPDIEAKTQTLTGTGILNTNSYQEVKLYDIHSDIIFGDTTANLDTISPESENFWILSVVNPSNTNIVSVGTAYTNGTINGQIRYYELSSSSNRALVVATKSSSIDFSVGQSITMGATSATLVAAERITSANIGISKTKYVKFLSGNSSSKIYQKNSSLFKLGLFGTEYFTKILCKNAVNFSVGKFITGQASGAVGIVESILTDTNEIILSQVSGQFKSGETLLSEITGTSTPYNFVESDGSIADMKVISFGSGYTSVSGITIFIDGVDQTNVIGTSNITIGSGQLRSVKITNAARLTLGTYNSIPQVTITDSGGGYGCSFTSILNTNTIINYDSSLIRSFFGSTTGNPFAGDIESKQDIFNVSNGASFSASEGSYYISADNLGTRPDLDLIKGDIIEVTDNSNVTKKYIVRYASPLTSGATSRIYVYGFVLSGFTAKSIRRLRSKLNGLTGNTLLMPLPNKNVKTAILNPSNTNINYTVQKEFLGNLDSSGSVTLTVGTNETFLSYSSDNYILTNPNTGQLIDLANVVSLGSSNQSVTISLGAAFNAIPFKLIAPVKKNDTVPKTKTLIKNQEYQIATGFFDPIIPLQYADGYKLNAVYMSASGADATVNDVDVTGRFIFDGGQRDTHYDLARLIRKPDAQVPTNKLLVVYSYFNHIGGVNSGDYFTVDSYTNIDYADIPNFNSSVYGNISLRDVVDFRPRVSNYTGLGTETVLPGYSDFATSNSIKFSGVGSSSPLLPLYGTSFDTGYQYYLNRIDALYISKDGSFTISKGTPSLNPQIPPEITDSILLNYFNIPAYTFNLSDVRVKSIDNRRYTMRDIGKLEKRIEKLEYYTVLSLLEQDTFNTQVRDEFGNERFKNGILVDNFEGHNVGNTKSADYSCSIDTQTGVARPSYYSSQTKLVEKNNNNLQRKANGYNKLGELITLPFTEQSTVSNPYATKTIIINPGKSAKFAGIITLEPNIDEWKDTTIAPELITNENSIFDTIQNNSNNLWGTIWNEWQISWIGTSNYNLTNSTSFIENSSKQFESSIGSVIKGKIRTRSRNGTQNRLTPYGSSSSSSGQKVVSSAYIPYIRSKIVKFVAKGLEPSTRLYAFFDGIDISAWVNSDDVTNIATPFTGIAGYSEKGFGSPIITDLNGNVSGVFLIPSGYAPQAGKKSIDYTNSINSFYDITGIQRRFTVGSKTFRLTSSSVNTSNNAEVSTFTECEYTVIGYTDSGNVSSTRIPSISRRSASNSDTVQFIGSTRVNINQSGLLDPLSQTFTVSGLEEGIFASSIDLYFNSKTNPTGSDTDRPVSVYLTETSLGVPTRNIIPFSQISMNADTILRIKLLNDVSTGITFVPGETITGKISGASGTIKKTLTVSSSNTRYNLTLSNHNGISFVTGEEFVVNRSPSIASTKFFIDQDAGIVEKIKVNTFGSQYLPNQVTININGDNGGNFGSVSTASPKIYNGKIYQIDVTNPGSGYYTPPTVIITGGDGLATAEAFIRITNPAVKMGIATSTNASIKTTFTFPSPIHLQNDTTYAIIVTSSSPDYKLYSSRVGDALLNSVITASNQSNVGSLYKAQNSSAWIEDQIEDIKFNINRCVFDTSATATVEFINDNIDYVSLPQNPITVDNTLGSSSLFGANQKVIRISHPNHGMKDGDTVIISNVSGIGSPENIFGISVNLLNGIHSISNVGLDDYCIQIDSILWNEANIAMTGSGSGGGSFVNATTNKTFDIIQSQVATLSFPSSTIAHSIRTAYGKAVDSTTTNEYTLAPSINISPDDNFYFESTRVIASRNNEVFRNNSVLLNGKSSISYTLLMQTTKDNVSPVIDINRSNIITIGSRIDNPTGNESRFGTKSQTLTVPQSSSFVLSTTTKTVTSVIIDYPSSSGGNFVNTIDSNTRLTQVSSGASGQIVSVDLINKKLKLIDVVGSFVANNSVVQGSVNAIPTNVITKTGIIIGWDSGTGSLKVKLTSQTPFQIDDIINDNDAGTSPVTARIISAVSNTGGFLFVPENNAYSSSSASKYVTKEVILETPGTSLDCKITANLFNNKDIKVLYKIRPDGSTEDFNKISWEYFNGTGLSDNFEVIPSNLKSLSPSVEDLDSYIEYKYTAKNLKPFNSFAIKVVFASSNPALAPRLEDLRVIAHS